MRRHQLPGRRPDRFRFSGEGYYLRTADEMRALDSSDAWAEACRNTLLIAERVGSYEEVFAHRDLAAKFPVPDGETEMTWLRKEAARGAVGRYGDPVPANVTERIEYELGVIEQMGFPGYFLVVADICQYARENGIGLGPGRGSATGSMVAYVTGITELDPIEHSLLFERFLNPERVSMPDVDLDFDERRRGDMIRYVTEKYGEDNVSLIITYMHDQVQGRGQGLLPHPRLPLRPRRQDHQGVPARQPGQGDPAGGDLRGGQPALRRGRRTAGHVRGRARRQEGDRHRPRHRGADPRHRRPRRRHHLVVGAARRRDAGPPAP